MNYPVDDLIYMVIQWGDERGLTGSDNFDAQFGKFLEESEELSDDLYNGEDITNELGDVLVTLILLAETKGIRIDDALGAAYSKISKRKGETINGVFIKNDGEL